MNEEEFIEKLRQNSALLREPLVLGIGDDAAVFKPNPKALELLATDMLCEGVHFLPEEDPKLVGRKALAVNLSDIAAMGGAPTLALVSLAFPASRGADYGLKLMDGVQELARDYGVQICGGDTNRSAHDVNICVTILGECRRPVLRSGAKPGDGIFVTGTLGASLPTRKHLLFKPRVREALRLNEHYKVHSMTDISDGLVRDLGHILKESHCGAILDQAAIPITQTLTSLNPDDQISHAMTDGEDFELVFTAPIELAESLSKDPAFFDCPVTCIGKVQKKPGLFWTSSLPIKLNGYTHLWNS